MVYLCCIGLWLLTFNACDIPYISEEDDESSLEDTVPLLLLSSVITNSSTSSSTCPLNAPPSGVALADTVISAPGHTGSGFKNSSLAINGVCGGGLTTGSLDVYEMSATGSDATMVLEWATVRITNGSGTDFIVFENAFYVNSNPNQRFMEPVIVEVYDDTSGRWCGFNGVDYNPGGGETVYSNNPAHWVNFAGVTPVQYNQTSNALSAAAIFDPNQGGGDGFDLSNLSGSAQFSNDCNNTARTNIQTNGFYRLRLRAASKKSILF